MFGTNYVGVDIGSGNIVLMYQNKIYEVKTPENTIDGGEILQVEKLSETIKHLISDNKLAGKKAIISYNGPSIFTKVINLPPMSDSELEKYLKLEMENLIPFQVEEGALDYIEINKDEKNMVVLLIALKNELILPYIEAVKQGGLIPYAIDIPALALGRVIFKEDLQGLQLIMDIGKESTDIHIYIDSIFRFSRSVKIGFDNLSTSDLEREVSRSIDYFRYSYGNPQVNQFTHAYLIGEDSSVEKLKKLVKETIEIEPTIVDESKGILAKGLELWRGKI